MNHISAVTRLLQFTDSMFPVGTFSFSNALETAGEKGLVFNAETLEQFTWAQVVQGAYTDGIAALLAYRAFKDGDYEKIVEIDNKLMQCKMNDESRLMLQRMGKKLAELQIRLFDNEMVRMWLEDIKIGKTPGSYPVAQGIAFAAAGIDEIDLFCSHAFGVANMIVGAALRCVRVSHYDTQEILYRFSERYETLYENAKEMTLDDMNAFAPENDILASLHEKGNMRMFMN
ncbi:MAG: urease accessory protein UreF [Bacteroidales bacterium]|nr:urease accessory protein UreF [Bacteroidales bacterium]